ncbi:MAG: FliM/FliN family flagellar motor switch protein [Myxococcales bacterium]|nr:FliM/FliN family flagellar motor switch protein [Myxococcales bacterium]MCB9582269.1 FliM/FliN family flagellar motor switch protein [Polyangiaceae bacterium]
MRISPYPWDALERLSHSAVALSTGARHAVARAVRVDRLSEAASAVLAGEVIVVLQEIRAADAPSSTEGTAISARTRDGSAEITLTVDDELAATAVARLLSQPVKLGAPHRPTDPALRGAFAALVMEIARRAHGEDLLSVWPSLPAAAGPGVEAVATVLLDGRGFGARAWVRLPPQPTRGSVGGVLSRLGHTPVALGVVVALGLADPGELTALQVGDAWLPGEGLWIDAGGAGRAALAAPGTEHGLGVDLSPDGRIVVRGDLVALSAEVDMADGEGDVGDVIAEAPLVVRVEVGSVTLSAREWAALRPGDVIETGHRIADPVVLRIGGREVARGELVSVEGEVGVRIRSLSTGNE